MKHVTKTTAPINEFKNQQQFWSSVIITEDTLQKYNEQRVEQIAQCNDVL